MSDRVESIFRGLKLPEPDRPNAVASDDIMDFSVLDAHRIDLVNPPAEPVSVIKLLGQQISTAGNLTVVAAQAKAGKTAVVGAMIAAVLAFETADESEPGLPDLLGFSAAAAGGKAVIVFDTEQAPFDAWTLVNRAVHRAQAPALPPNFRCYYLADVATRTRRQWLHSELQRAKTACGGIHCVFVDGVADLCIDPNNMEEAFGLVDELIQLAIKYACPIILVLHENPSGRETGKTRGHLGSQLERKAESNLRVSKGVNGLSTIYSDQCRRASIPKEHGARFVYDPDAGMHVTVASDPKEDKLEARREKFRPEINEVFSDNGKSFKYATLSQRIMDHLNLRERSAERRIGAWTELGLIEKNPSGDYARL